VPVEKDLLRILVTMPANSKRRKLKRDKVKFRSMDGERRTRIKDGRNNEKTKRKKKDDSDCVADTG